MQNFSNVPLAHPLQGTFFLPVFIEIWFHAWSYLTILYHHICFLFFFTIIQQKKQQHRMLYFLLWERMPPDPTRVFQASSPMWVGGVSSVPFQFSADFVIAWWQPCSTQLLAVFTQYWFLLYTIVGSLYSVVGSLYSVVDNLYSAVCSLYSVIDC